MKLNPNSWHAKFYRFGNQNKSLPTNLCPYVLALAGAAMAWVVFGLAVGLCLYVPYSIGLLNTILATLFIAATFGLILEGVCLVCWMVESDNPFTLFLKAKKEKYCPQIEWEEENESSGFTKRSE